MVSLWSLCLWLRIENSGSMDRLGAHYLKIGRYFRLFFLNGERFQPVSKKIQNCYGETC